MKILRVIILRKEYFLNNINLIQMKTFFVIFSWVFVLALFSCSNNKNMPDLGLAAIKDGKSRGVTSHAPGGSNADRLQYIHPSETVVIFDVEGAGVINHI